MSEAAAQQVEAPRERPILFNGDMVRAILAGQKTQTRRVVKAQPADVERHGSYIDSYCSERKTPENPRGMSDWFTYWLKDNRQGRDVGRCPYGKPGDLLWVRETWAPYERMEDGVDGITFRADGHFEPIENTSAAAERWVWVNDSPKRGQWRPSIHMPRWASRLTLRVTDVRVERVQSISVIDAKAEGVEPAAVLTYPYGHSSLEGFRLLWDSVATDGVRWADNPWVWAVTFERVP